MYISSSTMSTIVQSAWFSQYLMGPAMVLRAPVRAVVTDTTAPASLTAGSSYDNVTLLAGDRLLLVAQSSAINNGIYVVRSSGAAIRDDDFQVGFSAAGLQITVLDGDSGAGAVYQCTNKLGADVVGTNALTFVKSSVATGALPVAQGGTGRTTLTSNRFLVGNGTGAVDLSVSVPGSGIVVGTTDTQTLTNKTLDDATTYVLNANTYKARFDGSALSTDRVFSFPNAAGALVVDGATQNLTNKSLEAASTSFYGTNSKAGKFEVNTNVPTSTTVTLQFPDTNGIIATQAYVDSISQGLTVKSTVEAGSTANVSISSAPATLDNHTLVNGDRVLLKAQTDPIENGIYVFNGTGSALTRASDFAVGYNSEGSFVFVSQGTNGSTGWVVTSEPSIVGTDSIIFTQFSAAGQYVAGNGIDITGATISSKLLANGGLVFNGTSMQVDLGASSITGTVATGHGGTGLTSFTSNTFLTASSSSALASSKVVPAGVVVGTTDNQELTSKTITSGRYDALFDTNGAKSLDLPAAASAVNYLILANSATGAAVSLSSAGSDANIDLVVNTKGTGLVELRGDSNPAALKFKSTNSNAVTLKAAAGMSGNPVFVLPAADGSSGQVLCTNGSGTLDFRKLVRKNSFSIFSSQAYAISTTLGAVSSGYFVWDNTRLGGSLYSSGYVSFYASNLAAADNGNASGCRLQVELYNLTDAGSLGSLTLSGTTDGVYGFSFTLPTSDALLCVRIAKTVAGSAINPICSCAQIDLVYT